MKMNKRWGTGLGVAGCLVAALAAWGAHVSAQGTASGGRCGQEASACAAWNSPDNPEFPRLPALITSPRSGGGTDGR
jgi:hypothetical protein